MRRSAQCDSGLADPNSTRVRRSLLGTRIPLVSLIQAVAVGEHLNFRHAARALGVSQSSVSERIRALEETLGVRLFERRHHGVQVTEAGRLFLAHVAEGVDQLEYAVKTAGMIRDRELGSVRVGVPTTIAAGFLSNLLHCYRERWPGIDVEIFDGRARDAILQVREGKLDVAFIAWPFDVSDCHSKQLWTEPLLATLPASDTRASADGLHWHDLADDLFLVRYGGTGPQVHDHIVRRFDERGLQPKVHRCDVGRDMVLSMVVQGYGVTLCSEATSLIPLPGVAFVRLRDEPEPVRFSAVWSPHNTSQALRDLLDLARRQSTVKSRRVISEQQLETTTLGG
jgi:DNA-binding transcriptional LysR family regulator